MTISSATVLTQLLLRKKEAASIMTKTNEFVEEKRQHGDILMMIPIPIFVRISILVRIPIHIFLF